MDGAAADHPAGVGQVDAQAQVQQAGIEQIQVGAVLPDIGHRLPDQRLGYLLRGIEDLLPAALVHPEDPEADVRTGTGEFGPDLIPGTADAGFADLTDGLEARLGGLALLTAGLGQLHHNEAAAAAVLRVEAHHRVGGGGGAGEEVQAYEILPRNRADQGPQQVHGLWVVKQFPAAEQLPQLRVSVGDVGNDVLEQRPAEVPDLGVDLIPTGRCGEHDQIIWLVRNLLPGPPPGMVLVHAVPICMGRQLEPPGPPLPDGACGDLLGLGLIEDGEHEVRPGLFVELAIMIVEGIADRKGAQPVRPNVPAKALVRIGHLLPGEADVNRQAAARVDVPGVGQDGLPGFGRASAGYLAARDIGDPRKLVQVVAFAEHLVADLLQVR